MLLLTSSIYSVADEAIKEGIPNYPCQEHKTFVISEIIKTFLLLRIRRVIRDFKDVEKINQHKKKLPSSRNSEKK